MSYKEMKQKVPILLVDESQAGAMCGKISVFRELCAEFGIKPVIARHSCKLWSVEQIEAAVRAKTHAAQQEAVAG